MALGIGELDGDEMFEHGSHSIFFLNTNNANKTNIFFAHGSHGFLFAAVRSHLNTRCLNTRFFLNTNRTNKTNIFFAHGSH